MIILIAKLSLMIGLPAAAAIVWQKRTHAHWYNLLSGFGAFAVYYLVRIPLDLVLPPFLELVPLDGGLPPPLPNPMVIHIVYWWGIGTYWVLQVTILGIFRESTRWLMFRYVATNVRSWRDGVMFGIGYSCIATVLLAGELASDLAVHQNLLTYSLVEIITTLNNEIGWGVALRLAWRWALLLMVFNVGTSLVVLFSVQRRDIRFLLLAVMLYVVFAATPFAVFFRFPYLQLGWMEPPLALGGATELTRLLVTLPPLWLIFRLRKIMDQKDMPC